MRWRLDHHWCRIKDPQDSCYTSYCLPMSSPTRDCDVACPFWDIGQCKRPELQFLHQNSRRTIQLRTKGWDSGKRTSPDIPCRGPLWSMLLGTNPLKPKTWRWQLHGMWHCQLGPRGSRFCRTIRIQPSNVARNVPPVIPAQHFHSFTPWTIA